MPEASSVSRKSPALSIRDLKFRYGRARRAAAWVVDVPQLELAAGEQLLLEAGSGQGKSTLLHLIAGLIEPTSGTVQVKGRDLFRQKPSERDRFRGRTIGMIFQTFNLLHGFSALENVMMAMVVSDIPRGKHRRHASSLLKELGIDRPRSNPDRMSVGQQQRVAVARALACDPALVLADEPTASLDPANSATAMDLIQTACRNHGAALLCTSHDPVMTQRFENCRSLQDLSRPNPASEEQPRTDGDI